MNKQAKKTLQRIFAYTWKDYKWQLAVVVLGIFISSSAIAMGSRFLQVLIDGYIMPLLSQKEPDFRPLAQGIFKMAAIYLAGIIASYVYNYLMADISEGTMQRIRDDMFKKMQDLEIRYFDQNAHGDIMSRYTNDSDTLRMMLSQSAPSVLSSLIQFMTVFLMMITLNISLTLVTVISVILISMVGKIIAQNANRYFIKQQHAVGDINGFIEETMNGQKVVKVFNKEVDMIESFQKINHEWVEHATLANKFANIMMPVMMNLINLEYTIVGVVGGILALKGYGITIGMVAAFLQLARNFSFPITNISQQANSVIMALAGAERIFSLMDETQEMDEGNVTLVKACLKHGVYKKSDEFTGQWAWAYPTEQGEKLVPLRGDVRFFDVDFGYDESHTVLHDITLYAEEGQKVAFVGSTGAGKTTITNLINRFYEIKKGKITYDGIDIRQIKKSDLRRSLGIILQDVHLFTGTILENIRYGNLYASDEDCIQAAKLANAHSFIQELPDGYQTVIEGNGGSLSQGQMQLISIARAAVANPPVMIMDEATSSIDTRTENLVQQGMDLLMQGRTVFVIAHRLSTVRNSDVIMVLEHGRIIERGDHDALMEKRGVYYQLNTGQLELD